MKKKPLKIMTHIDLGQGKREDHVIFSYMIAWACVMAIIIAAIILLIRDTAQYQLLNIQ